MHQAQSAVGCSASRIKGELHPIKTRLCGGCPHLVRTFSHMDDSFEETTKIWPLPETLGILCNCLGAPYHMHYHGT